MRWSTVKSACALAVTALVVARASAGFGEIVASFPAPAANPEYLAWGAPYLYCFTNNPGQYLIWRLNPATGAPVDSVASPFGAATCGLVYDGAYFRAGDKNRDVVYRFKWNGSILSSFAAGWDVGLGLGWDGFHLWATEPKIGGFYRFYQVRVDGFILSSFTVYDRPSQPTCDLVYIWAGTELTIPQLYRLNAYDLETGFLTKSLPSPADNPSGAVWDGRYLWVSTLASPPMIWKIDLAGLSVEPQSMGKIKTLFR